MGVSIFCANNFKIRYSDSYSALFTIRENIAKAYNYEIGRIYQNSKPLKTKEERDEADKQFTSIYQIANAKTKKIMKFLCIPDTKGKVTKTTCKLIYDLKDKVFKLNLSEYETKIIKEFYNILEKSLESGISWG